MEIIQLLNKTKISEYIRKPFEGKQGILAGLVYYLHISLLISSSYVMLLCGELNSRLC